MFEPSQTSPGEWLNCLNVGDDHIEDKDERRKYKDLTIPGFSLVEIVGIRKFGDDHYVHEVRLPVGELPVGQDQSGVPEEDQVKIVPIGINYAFTGPADIRKDRQGRMKFPPAYCRFKGDEDDTAKIFGRYEAPERQLGGKFTEAEYEAFEFQEKLFGNGIQQQLVGDPTGHLKLPSDIAKSSQFGISSQYLGWNCMGIYKYNTGKKTKGKKEDEDATKNLLAYIAPAAQISPRPPIRFVALEAYSTYITRVRPAEEYSIFTPGTEYTVKVDGDKPIKAAVTHLDSEGNHKQLISFVGDNVNGEIRLVLDEDQTELINLKESVLTPDYLAQKIGDLPNIGAKNLKVSVWPGLWLIEFAGDLAGKTFNNLEVIRPEDAEFQVHITCTDYADSELTVDVYFHIPQIGRWDGDDNVINDAVAPGAIGDAVWFNGQGFVAMSVQCRDFNGDGTPDL
ncbi:hypothetical protein [Gimesia aquarii]|uniref:Uncharacterized protein n=1 Tax=Gimesia aquarii TaxID=2527964 RepID=A0A517WNK1_9PLAN|nr:hypothetical protein [Gimesia aquarii]QDU06840.1 hypothetical protein V202x_01830 [Gimesia aquarii]